MEHAFMCVCVEGISCVACYTVLCVVHTVMENDLEVARGCS